MARTTAELVEGIIEVDSTIPVTPFIEAANAIVTRVLASFTEYNDEDLELIERWLSAHFYAIRDPRVTSESAAGLGQSFQHREGLIFQSTQFGQMALVLDTSGRLAALSMQTEKGRGGRTVGVRYVGSSHRRGYGRCH